MTISASVRPVIQTDSSILVACRFGDIYVVREMLQSGLISPLDTDSLGQGLLTIALEGFDLGEVFPNEDLRDKQWDQQIRMVKFLMESGVEFMNGDLPSLIVAGPGLGDQYLANLPGPVIPGSVVRQLLLCAVDFDESPDPSDIYHDLWYYLYVNTAAKQ